MPEAPKVKVFETKCERCGLKWYNKDQRNYANDKCPSCKQNVTVVGLIEIELSRGPIPTPTREMELNVG